MQIVNGLHYVHYDVRTVHYLVRNLLFVSFCQLRQHYVHKLKKATLFLLMKAIV